MDKPFAEQYSRNDVRFVTPAEELDYLRAQVAHKERLLKEQGHNASKEAIVHSEIRDYAEKPAQEVLHDSHQISGGEVEMILKKLNLPPDKDDVAMEELIGILKEKGIKNSLLVLDSLKNPHLADDFHRVLIQYVNQGLPVPDFNEKTPLWSALHMTLFEITFPEETRTERSLKELVSVMEQFYMGMFSVDSNLKNTKEKYFSLEIAVSGEKEDIMFYMAVPSEKEDLFEKQLLSVFPKARAHHVPEDYNVFLHNGTSEISYATLKTDGILPLKDYREFDSDPLSALVNALTKIETVGEGAALQFIVNPIGEKNEKRYRTILDKVKRGTNLKEALKDTPDSIGGEVFKIFREFTASAKKQTKEINAPAIPDDIVIGEIQKKIETTVPNVNIRIVASAKTKERAGSILSDIESSFNQFYNTNGNAIIFKRALGKEDLTLTKQFTFREYSQKQALPLSVRELTTLMHFPTHAISATPQLRRLRSAEAPAPVGLPTQGTLLGINHFRGIKTKAHLTPEDRLRHLYIIGQTGTGKTAFMKNLILQDIQNGQGVCFIDPHGSDILDVLANIPESRIDDVIYFEPSNTAEVLGLNLLEYDKRFPEQKTFVINELFSIFKKLYAGTPESMGPAFEQYFRNATALVLEDPSTGSTMLDISRVLADAQYREVKLARSKNPVINQFWNEIATKAQGEASLQNIVPYITNKFDIFTANDIMRPIIAQQVSSFQMREVMDSSKILLVNLSKGKLGDINANLLGMVIVGKILMAALSRVDALASDLPPFYLYIDEFQNITTDSISAILSEARKYKLSLNIAHQFIAQLDPKIKDSVFGNVGSMAVFRVGSEDAEFFETQLTPSFTAQDIMNIENYHAYVRILAHGTPQKPFSIGTLPPKKGSPELAQHIKKLSLKKYARPLHEVEQEIRMRYSIG